MDKNNKDNKGNRDNKDNNKKEKPITSEGYEKYIIQIGWRRPEPNLLFALFAQDILARTKKEGLFLMKLLYPQAIGVGLPYLCPIIMEIHEDEMENFDEDGEPIDPIEQMIKEQDPLYHKRIELIHPN